MKTQHGLQQNNQIQYIEGEQGYKIVVKVIFKYVTAHDTQMLVIPVHNPNTHTHALCNTNLREWKVEVERRKRRDSKEWGRRYYLSFPLCRCHLGWLMSIQAPDDPSRS